MNQNNNITKQAVNNQGQKMIAKARMRTILSLVLLCCGGALLYFGISGQQPLFITIGVIFILYALFMRFHIRRTKTVMAELEQEIKKLTKTKEQGSPNPKVDHISKGSNTSL